MSKEVSTDVGGNTGTDTREINEQLGTSTDSNNRNSAGSDNQNSGGGKNSRKGTRKTGSTSSTTVETGIIDSDIGNEVTERIGRSGRSGRGTTGGSDRAITGSAGTDQKIVLETSVDGLEKKPKLVKPSRAASKAKTSAPKKDGSITDSETLATIIETAFGMLAGVTRRSHWQIDAEEAKTIAIPASTMIAKLTVKQRNKINQLAAPIMLGTAIVSVCMPRIIIDISSSQRGKNNARTISQGNTGNVQQIDSISGQEQTSVVVQTPSTFVDPTISSLFGKLD